MGMTFVGVAENAVDPDSMKLSENKRLAGKLCRITWVLYQSPTGQFELDVRNDPGRSVLLPTGVISYSLLRFIEIGTGDIDNFRVLMPATYSSSNSSQYVSLEQFIDIAANEFGSYAMKQLLEADESPFLNIGMTHEAIRQMRLREIWVRLLAGDGYVTDNGFVSFWGDGSPTDNRPARQDYVVAENILPPRSTNLATQLHWGEDGIDNDGDSLVDFFDVDEFPGFFQYGMMRPDSSLPVLLQYWQSVPNLNNSITPTLDGRPESDRIGSPITPRIPEVVHVKLAFGMPSPFPGAPDFLPQPFQQTIELPSGYVRSHLE